MLDPIVIEPPDFDQDAAWKGCQEHVEACGGLGHEDGSPNYMAAAGADPGGCGCPACGQDYWAWGKRQRCKKCGYEYPTDAWCMYSWGVQAAWAGRGRFPRYAGHPFYEYGYLNAPESDSIPEFGLHDYYESLDWATLIPGSEGVGT